MHPRQSAGHAPAADRRDARSFVSLLLVLIVCGAAPSAVAAADVEVLLRTFPAGANLHHVRADGVATPAIVPQATIDGRRLYRLPAGTRVVLAAAGFQSRVLHLVGDVASRIELDERLLPLDGPLALVAELPTGASPKSAVILPDGRIAVPMLRGPGVSVHPAVSADPTDGRALPVAAGGRVAPPSVLLRPPRQWADETGFVEPVLLPDLGELWVSQMTTDSIHRFRVSDGAWLGLLGTGGRWPKVLAREPDGAGVWVANWLSETVSRIESATGRVTASVPVGGQPRGMEFTDGGRLLWVCIFSSGDIEIVDTRSGTVADRLGLPRGAARHIVASPDGATLYYSDMYHGTVSAIDVATRRVTAVRRIGANPNTIVVSPDGRTLIASVRGRNNRESYLLPGPEYGRLVVLDAATLQPIQEVWGRNQPTGLAISPDGRTVVATDFLDDNLAVYRLAR